MIKIAHRGNTNGPSEMENHPDYILKSIEAGYDIETDLWVVDGSLWLGHDGPEYQVTERFLLDIGHAAWIHCKNIEALYFLNNTFPHLNYFWHQEDSFTLTSQGYIWTYPKNRVTLSSILVDLDNSNPDNVFALGVCSDYVDSILS